MLVPCAPFPQSTATQSSLQRPSGDADLVVGASHTLSRTRVICASKSPAPVFDTSCSRCSISSSRKLKTRPSLVPAAGSHLTSILAAPSSAAPSGHPFTSPALSSRCFRLESPPPPQPPPHRARPSRSHSAPPLASHPVACRCCSNSLPLPIPSFWCAPTHIQLRLRCKTLPEAARIIGSSDPAALCAST